MKTVRWTGNFLRIPAVARAEIAIDFYDMIVYSDPSLNLSREETEIMVFAGARIVG